MNDRYDWERDRALKRDRDPRNERDSDYSGQQGGGSRQQWASDGLGRHRYSSDNSYREGYDNRDAWRGSESDARENRIRTSAAYRGDYGPTSQTGDYFGPGDFGSGSHAYAANWDRGYGASRSVSAGYGAGRYDAGQASQREPRRWGDRQMGGYEPGEGYARDEAHRGFLDRAADEVMSWWGDEDAARRREQDHREDHRGRGPSDYTRTDERIREDANDRLTDDWRIDARKVSVAVEKGEVTLSVNGGAKVGHSAA